LNIEYFQPRKDSKDGFRNECRACTILKKKIYYQNNKNRFIEAAKQNYEKNKSHVANRRKENKELYVKHWAKYYKENKSKLAMYKSKYKKDNREKSNSYKQVYKARKKLLPSTLTAEQWEVIKKAFDNKCAYCGLEKALEQEHFIALSNGGEYTANNIICACRRCNSSKNNSNFFEWYPKQEFYSKAGEEKILIFLNYKEGIQQLKFL
jgi:5-methylcytosine-specific restriction endonuclease McrA